MVLESRFAALRAEERDAIEFHLLASEPLTLEEIGQLKGVTRERIRQLEVRGLKRLVEPMGIPKPGRPRLQVELPLPGALDADAAIAQDSEAVVDAIARVQGLPLPVTEGAFIEAAFGPFDATATRLLLVLAKKAKGGWKAAVEEHDGRRWLVGNVSPARLIARITDDVREVGVVEDLVELWGEIETRLRPHVGSDDEAEELAAAVVEGLNIIEVGSRCAILGGGISVPERLVRILRANGAPMTAAELLPLITDRSPRTITASLYDEPRIVQISLKEFALVEWGARQRPALLDLVFGVIDEHGEVAVDYLERLAAEHHYSPASITFYRAMPSLIEEAGVLRRRTAQDPSPICEPGLDGTCLRVIAGPHRGDWSTSACVSHRRLYVGSQKIAPPLAILLGLEPGAKGVPITINGQHSVRSTWGSYPYLFGGELRPVLDTLGFQDGTPIRIIVRGAADLLIESSPGEAVGLSPLAMLAAGAGLYDEAGHPVSHGELAANLAYAIGLAPETPLTMIGRRLAARRNAELYEAFEIVFADELSA
jgi:hypothetical protein